MRLAPRDGSWILLDVDDGTNDCMEVPQETWRLGRYAPKHFPELDANVSSGKAIYEWEILSYRGEFDHWSDGRMMGWRPLPLPREAA